MADHNFITVVSGLTRCGSTVTMKMLHMGGMGVVAGNLASYEDNRAGKVNTQSVWLQEGLGKAVIVGSGHKCPFVPLNNIG